MIIREEILARQPDFDFSIIAPAERIVFFDIETTGLMRTKSFVYLIGLVVYEDESWRLRQYFAEGINEEKALLLNFVHEIREKKHKGRVILISYNGDGFDIPFIKDAMRANDLGHKAVFTNTVSLDLLKLARPLKKLLGLDNCRLKTVEKLFGIERADKYSGGELILVYEEYLRLKGITTGRKQDNDLNTKPEDRLLEILLLHNAEDISDMPFIMGIYGYQELIAGNFKIKENKIVEYKNADGPKKVWDIEAILNVPIQKGLYFEQNGMVLAIGGEDPACLNMTAEVYDGELKYFYADYKNYYYLPVEDYAVHKTVGQYVDRQLRRQATKATCYQKKKGLFVPQAEPVLSPVFYMDGTKSQQYGEISGIFEKNDAADTAKRYILSMLKLMMQGKSLAG